jgi:hypothetical protein
VCWICCRESCATAAITRCQTPAWHGATAGLAVLG